MRRYRRTLRKGLISLRRPSRKKEPELCGTVHIPIVCAEPYTGLNRAQVGERMSAGLANMPVDPPTKTVQQIVLSNIFTYFNIIFFILAAAVIAVRSWYNLTFMGVVIANIVIGIIQQLKSKHTLDKLTLLTAPRGVVVRGGKLETLPTDSLVRDDIAVFMGGNQIYADALVVDGSCLVNEALLTGEADEIKKLPGDELLSGSFVVTGECRARLTRVGADSYASRLTLEAKKSGKLRQSEMMNSLSKLVMWIGIAIIPLGTLMCIKEISWLGRSIQDGIVSTVGSLVGMIPEGLYLLTTLALVAGVVRLAQRRTLVHETSCIETLARIDTLCVDKTGTITENKMVVEDVVLLCKDRFIEDDIRMVMADYVFAMRDDNDTLAALRRYFTGDVRQHAVDTLPFTSSKKFGGVSFHEDETYILGAPEIILGCGYQKYKAQIDGYSAKGCRVLLLALYDGRLSDEVLSSDVMPLALILLANKIRPEAPSTFAFFAKQGVTIKVISGDNPLTVSEVAKRAGIEGAERFVDAQTLHSDALIAEAAVKYNVFGRVTPEQKRKLVRALKSAGHTTAMTGDGVNDILAMKEADCSVAMASGSEVASQAANIVLLDSDFSSMPSVVMEGRRVINNIELAASLFLVKNIFSFVMAIITLCFAFPYPLTPSHLSLVSSVTIGIPSFILAMEPNQNIIKGRFLPSVLYRALPAGLTNIVLCVGILLFYLALSVSEDELGTICALILGIVGLIMLDRTCRPYNALRASLMAFCSAAFVFSAVMLRELFTITPLDFAGWLVLIVFTMLAPPIMSVVSRGLDKLSFFMSANRPVKLRFSGFKRKRTAK